MKHIILFLLILLPVATGGVEAKTITRVAAVVNADIITTYQLERAVETIMASRSDAADKQQLRQSALEQLINDQLLLQRARELDLRVSEQEIETAVEDVMSSNNLDRDALELALKTEGMTLDSYREQIRNDILRYKLMNQEVNYQAQVTSAEVRRHFEENIDQFDTLPRLHVSRISFPLPTDRTGDAFQRVQEQADKSRQRLLDGDSFDDVLQEVEDLADGDIMGELVVSDLAPPLQQALDNLATGDVSEPTAFNQQLHLFIINERRTGEELAFERARPDIEKQLRREKREQRFSRWQEELRANAYIDRRL
ncbi:MAG: SurA N-terminal domain-containing protein [Pelovirga sp.]